MTPDHPINPPPTVRNSAGFTLLELLIVLAILCLLAATLLPALAKSRPNTLAFQCLNNNRQLCLAWRTYADDNRDWLVYSSDDGSGASNPQNQYAWTWSKLDCSPANASNWDTNYDIVLRPLWPYTRRDASIYRCPADKFYFLDTNGVSRPRVRDFSMNIFFGGFGNNASENAMFAPYRIFLKTTDLTMPGPANTFVFIEERWETINWGNFYINMAGYYPNSPGYYVFDEDLPGYVHDLACSVSFGDGHAELHRWRDPRTTPALSICTVRTWAMPYNPDVGWLQDRATRPK